jgi:PAS domain S-box-containing protein
MRPLFQALTHTSDGAFIMNEKNQIIFWNQAAETLLGYTAEEVAGMLCYEILGGRDEQGGTLCQRYCRIAVSAAQGETLPTLDVFAQTRSGQGRWINVTTFTLPTGAPEIGNVIVHLFRDATDKKSDERFINHILEASRELRDETERPGLSMPAAESAPDPRLDALTPREREVLLLLAHGLGTGEIADTLSISPATTRNHVQSVLSKLEVHSRLEAVAYAYQRGLVEVSDEQNSAHTGWSDRPNNANDPEK